LPAACHPRASSDSNSRSCSAIGASQRYASATHACTRCSRPSATSVLCRRASRIGTCARWWRHCSGERLASDRYGPGFRRAAARIEHRAARPQPREHHRAGPSRNGDSVTTTAARRERAQSVLEFALVVPLFLLLIFGLIDFARLLFTYASLSNGAREMARVAAVSTNWSGSNAISAFNNYVVIAGGQNSSTDTVTVLTADTTCARQ